MLRRILLAAGISAVIPVISLAEWVSLDKNNTTKTLPVVSLVSDDISSSVIRVEISGFELKEFDADGNHYQQIDLLTEAMSVNPGYPELPYIAKILAIPDQAGISIEVVETGEVYSFSDIHLPPARKSWVEGDPPSPYIKNPVAYQSDASYPGEFVSIDNPSVFRDFRIARVSIFPVQYLAKEKKLQVISSITVKINYGGGEVINPKTNPKKPIAPSFGALYRSSIFNYQSVLDQFYDGKETGHEMMLCIMPDEFVASFQMYADWKRQSGIDIHVTKFSDIGATATDPDIVKAHISDAFHNWEFPPSYVLIIGDEGIFPKKIVTYPDYSFPSDNYFVEIDGDDYFPEMMIGRFTNQGDYRMQVMINKFKLYEKTPYTASTDWFKKGICCSNDNYESQIETKRFAAERMLQDGGFTSVDTMMSDPGCTYNNDSVIAAINNGRSWLNYRGEGWSYGWWATCTPLHTENLTSIDNGQKFPFVTSIGCGVAMFDVSGGNSFGEEWVEMGSLSVPEGAAAFIGPTSNTHTTYNNKIDRGIYVGMFQEGMDTPGQAMLRGKLYMYNSFGNVYYVEYHYQIYLVLGDPSIHIWKDIPKSISVNYPPTIPFGTNLVEFTVNFSGSGQPVENATVCLTSNNFFITGQTDASGKAWIEITPEIPETLTVTVRGGNVIPFQGTMEVIQPEGPYVIREAYALNDLAGGNGNSLMDYGESILLSLSIKNVGTGQANNVAVTLSTEDPYITFTDNTHTYESIPAGEVIMATDAFAFDVANYIPDGHFALVTVLASGTGKDTWISNFSMGGHAPVFSLGEITVYDPMGNNDGKIDPGETADIIIYAENIGSSEAFNAIGELISNDPFLAVNTAEVNYGDILANGSVFGTFNVTASPYTPLSHPASLTFSISADFGITGSGNFELLIGHYTVLIIDLDGNTNSAPAIQAALLANNQQAEYVNSFPADLSQYNGIFLCLGVYTDNHVLTNDEGQLLADYLSSGGRLYMEGADTWAYDPDTPVHSMFNIIGQADGTADLGIVLGQSTTFTAGMAFNYDGDNGWIDHLGVTAPARLIFANQSPSYGCAVAYNAMIYKTIGTSFEFGGLVDGTSPSTMEELMYKYLEFFDLLPPQQIIANFKVFLEGPFEGSSMNATMGDIIPLSQPFNTLPWNYSGTESVTNIPANVVDWVLVDLRDATSAGNATSATRIARQAGFILNTGRITEVDGISPMIFPMVPENNLYTVIYHKNHLAVLSANAILNEGGIYNYDFSTGSDKFFGGIYAGKEFVPGVWGMAGGDGDCNGIISTEDYSVKWRLEAGEKGYRQGDFSLDGEVNNVDKDDFWKPNLGKSCMVPD